MTKKGIAPLRQATGAKQSLRTLILQVMNHPDYKAINKIYKF